MMEPIRRLLRRTARRKSAVVLACIILLALAAAAALYRSLSDGDTGSADTPAAAVETDGAVMPAAAEVNFGAAVPGSAPAELQGMKLAAENPSLALYYDPETTEIAVRDKRSGTLWFSNPVDRDADPKAAADQKEKLISQVSIFFQQFKGDGDGVYEL